MTNKNQFLSKSFVAKVLSFVMITSLFNFVYFSDGAFAKETSDVDANEEIEENVVMEIDLNSESLPAGFNFSTATANGIMPLNGGAAVIEVDKPIAYQGFLNYATLVKMEKAQRDNMSVLDIISDALIPTGAGIAISVAKAFDNGPTKLQQAVNNGDHAYVVTVYANGVPNSLSKITYIYYTKQSLRFVYKK